MRAALLCLALVVSGFAIAPHSAVSGQAADRLWLAGRYDSTRVLIYFDAVQFGDGAPDTKPLPAAAADGLFLPPQPIAMATRIALEQQYAGIEHVRVGDRYSLLRDTGRIASITISQLVAGVGDEVVGNSSYVGALATVAPGDLKYFTRDYYAVHRSMLASVERPVPPALVERITIRFRGLVSQEGPRLAAIIALGNGRTGLVIDTVFPDGRSLQLREYQDEKDLNEMPVLWSIDAAE